MGEEDPSIFAKGSAWVAPRLTSKTPRGKRCARARAGSDQPPCATSQTDTLTLGAGPGAARGYSVFPAARGFSAALEPFWLGF